MSQKFRNRADLDIVAPAELIADPDAEKTLSNGRTRRVGFYASSEPADVNAEVLQLINDQIADQAAPKPPVRRPRRTRKAS